MGCGTSTEHDSNKSELMTQDAIIEYKNTMDTEQMAAWPERMNTQEALLNSMNAKSAAEKKAEIAESKATCKTLAANKAEIKKMKMDVTRLEMMNTYINASGSLSMMNVEFLSLDFLKMDADLKKQWCATSIIYNNKFDAAKVALTNDELIMCTKDVSKMPKSTTE